MFVVCSCCLFVYGVIPLCLLDVVCRLSFLSFFLFLLLLCGVVCSVLRVAVVCC